jgi:hypothetical protein
VDVAISKLRRKFDDNAGEARKIKTVWGKGYLFSRSSGSADRHAQDPGAPVPGDHRRLRRRLAVHPDTIVGLFRERFMAYNLDQAKGVQSLIVRQFRRPRASSGQLEQELAKDFAPLDCSCCAWTRPV